MGLDDERAHLIDNVPSYQDAVSAPPYSHNNQPVFNHAIQSSPHSMSANAQNSPIQPPNYHQHPHHYQHNHPTYQTIPQVVSVMPQVILVGGCPCCRVGVLEDDYSCLGICCAILCFPIGILCCLLTKQRRCSNCGAVYG